MPDKEPKKYRRVPSRRKIGPPKPTVAVRRPKPQRRRPLKILSRSASEPILFTVRLLSPPHHAAAAAADAIINDQPQLSRSPGPHTLIHDFFSSSAPQLPMPSAARPNSMDEVKVVMSVEVEGSPGPVRAMMKLGSTVGEAVGIVVDRYKREGRSPRLDCDGEAESFQLHHSHFSLQSLNKADKIGEVGGRSFYLRKSCSNNSFSSECQVRYSLQNSEIEAVSNRLQRAPPPIAHLFFACIERRLRKIRRRTKRLWRVVTCIACG